MGSAYLWHQICLTTLAIAAVSHLLPVAHVIMEVPQQVLGSVMVRGEGGKSGGEREQKKIDLMAMHHLKQCLSFKFILKLHI